MMFDLVVNAGLAVVDAAVLWAVWKKIKLVTFPRLAAIAVILPILGIPVLFVVGLFAFLRILAWAVFVHLVILLVGEAVLVWKHRRKTAIASLAAAALIGAVGIDAFFVEPYRLEVTRVTLSSPKLKRTIRIAILSDIQTDVVGEYEKNALRLAAEEKPDVVLFTGDYIQEHKDEERKRLNRELREALIESGLARDRIAIAVGGDCDGDDWTQIFEGTGIEATNEGKDYDFTDLRIRGLTLMESEYEPISFKSSDKFHIVVGHRPDFALKPVPADLLVAGHTHGGQVRLPFIGPLITLSRIPRDWAAGVTTLGDGRTLIVSRGIGMERGRAPRLRFLCRPQLVIVDVIPPKGQ